MDWVLQNKRSYLLRPPRTPLLNFVQRGAVGGARHFGREREDVVAGAGVGVASRHDVRLFSKHRNPDSLVHRKTWAPGAKRTRF